MTFNDVIFNMIVGIVILVVVVFVVVIIGVMLKGILDEDVLSAQYLADFTDVVDYCGEISSHTTYSLADSGDFAVGHFLDCLSRNNVVFALNGDTVKVNTP